MSSSPCGGDGGIDEAAGSRCFLRDRLSRGADHLLHRISLSTEMSIEPRHFAFAVIAMREVEFFAAIGEQLREGGHAVSFISFYAPGNAYLRARGFDVFDLHAEAERIPVRDDLWAAMGSLEKRHGLRFRELTLHERLTFRRFNDRAVAEKLHRYVAALAGHLRNVKPDVITQELGGFIAPLALYLAAREEVIDHIFLEPTLFRGRLFFALNELKSPMRSVEQDQEVRGMVQQHLESYRADKTVAMPAKDRHHFRDATLGKLVNLANVRKLWRKLYFKYMRRKPEEYDAIGNHVRRSVGMWWNRIRSGRLYSGPEVISPQKGPYVYFPFHVPIDFALTVRARPYMDQLNLIKFIANSLPPGIRLLVKEHPASIGAYSPRDMGQALEFDNLVLLQPSINSFDIVANSEAVVTINSKVGAEALMQGKPVVVLGDCFYRSRGLTVDVDSLSELGETLHRRLSSGDLRGPDEEAIHGLLRDVYGSSHPGELYVAEDENMKSFTTSLLDVVSDRGTGSGGTPSDAVALTSSSH
jgi:Capsule polysaccharide biosynthesis protein